MRNYIPPVNLTERLKAVLGNELTWESTGQLRSRVLNWLSKHKHYLAVAAGPISCLLVLLGADLDNAAESKQVRMFGALLWMAIWWLTEVSSAAPSSLSGFFVPAEYCCTQQLKRSKMEHSACSSCRFLRSQALA